MKNLEQPQSRDGAAPGKRAGKATDTNRGGHPMRPPAPPTLKEMYQILYEQGRQ